MMERKTSIVALCAAALMWASAGLVTAQDQATPPAAPQAASQARPTTAPPAPARAPEPAQEPRAERPPARLAFESDANVRIEVTITYQVGNGAPVKRSASFTAAEGDSTASLRVGNQIAVPSTTTYIPKTDGGSSAPPAPVPTTSYNYRSVGINIDARRIQVSGGKAKLTLNVEFSAVDDKAADAAKPPSFPTFSQSFALILESGKPVVIAQSSDFVDNVERKQSVEVRATILR
jgi:hypothetical protein